MFLLLPPPKIFIAMAHSNPKAHYHHDKLSSSSSSSSPPLSVPAPPLPPDSSLTIDFLMESGGLSYVQAIQVILKKPTLLKKGGKKPRLVIAYFESLSFSKTHISKLISKSPRVLVSDVEKTLKPKIQLFQDFGFSKSDVAELMSSNPTLLRTGVKTQMKPALDLIKRFVKTDEDLFKIIKRNGYLLVSNIRRKSIQPNVDVLRHHGLPDSEILHLIFTRLSILMSTPKVFKSVVERIVSLGFKPVTRKFSTAVSAMSGMKKATWDSKMDLLKGLGGWSDEQILDAFRRNPRYLKISGEKMKESIEFFKESLNWDASVLSQDPLILTFSLKRRVIPRYAVFKCLMSKDIIKQGKQFISMVLLNETNFLTKYVFKYQEQLPYLYAVYNKECILGCEKDNGDIDMTV